MTFPHIPTETWHTVGTAFGAIISGILLILNKSTLLQLRGPRNEVTGHHGKCLRDLILEVMSTVNNQASLSELRHAERIQALDDFKTSIRLDLGRLELRVSATETTLAAIKPAITK